MQHCLRPFNVPHLDAVPGHLRADMSCVLCRADATLLLRTWDCCTRYGCDCHAQVTSSGSNKCMRSLCLAPAALHSALSFDRCRPYRTNAATGASGTHAGWERPAGSAGSVRTAAAARCACARTPEPHRPAGVLIIGTAEHGTMTAAALILGAEAAAVCNALSGPT